MTTARLSPAATLLRNSRLFALPHSIPGPPPQPSSEPVGSSDTATPPWPTQAAIATPLNSQVRGDWGLKRPLPLKSTGRDAASSIRIRGGIDTAEHIADFESAADHVVTLRKWQELTLPITLPKPCAYAESEPSHTSAFSPVHDNIRRLERPQTRAAESSIDGSNSSGSSVSPTQYTRHTGIWPDIDSEAAERALPEHLREELGKIRDLRLSREAVDEERRRKELGQGAPSSKVLPSTRTFQKYLRWRHEGPWLAGMTDDEFETWLSRSLRDRKEEFRETVRDYMKTERKSAAKFAAQESGRPFDEARFEASFHVSEADITAYLRLLRSRPEVFGPLIAQFFDLPEGPLRDHKHGTWPYGRETVASTVYPATGPPRTHPSAGLSYIRSSALADNDPSYGPQAAHATKIGRILKSQPRWRSAGYEHSVGLAGFVANTALAMGVSDRSRMGQFEPQGGGRKIPVRPVGASVGSDGYLALKYLEDTQNYRVVGNAVLRPDQAAAKLKESRDQRLPAPATRPATHVAPLDRSMSSLSDSAAAGKAGGGRSARKNPPGPKPPQPTASSLSIIDEMTRAFGGVAR